jgi:hypothetical protein
VARDAVRQEYRSASFGVRVLGDFRAIVIATGGGEKNAQPEGIQLKIRSRHGKLIPLVIAAGELIISSHGILASVSSA